MKRIFACAGLLAASMLACRTRGNGQGGASAIKPIELRPPVGDKAAAHHCHSGGWGCEPLSLDTRIELGRLVRTVPGSYVALAVDQATTIDLGPDAEVLLVDERTLEARRGSITVRALGSHEAGQKGLRLRIGGSTAEVDARFGGDFSVRSKDGAHGILTVERGRMTLQGADGDTTIVLSGETIEIAAGRPPERLASPLAIPRHGPAVLADTVPRSPLPVAPRGLGSMTARVPGRTEVVSGVVLASHHVQVALRDGFARTEIEEVFRNETSQVLEGRYVFPLPTDASISRLTLWVGDKPVEGEIVEKKRAATIFRSIVEETVRPRDPALLEWVSGGDFSLKVFPLPAKGTRKVRIAYDQVLPESAGRVRYVYPLGVGAERATDVADFALHVQVSDTRAKLDDPEVSGYPAKIKRSGGEIDVELRAGPLRPTADFVLTYARQHTDAAELSTYVPGWGDSKRSALEGAAVGAQGSGYFALRVSADLPAGGAPVPHQRQDRVLVVDASHGQSQETLAGALRIALGLVRHMDPDERFAVLACDSACSSYPEDGLASAADAASLAALERWAEGRAPNGSSDVAGALIAGARRLELTRTPTWGGSTGHTATSGMSGTPGLSDTELSTRPGQLVYLGDGAPSSGELTAETIAARVQSVAGPRLPDLRMFGVGRSVDEMTLTALARSLGATYEAVQTNGSLGQRIAEVALGLRSPVITNPRIELPPTFNQVYPSSLPNLRLGQQCVLVGRLLGTDSSEIRLTGTLAGQPYSVSRRIQFVQGPSQQNPLVPRLWAQAHLAELESSGDAKMVPAILDVSKQYHVMSRYTSLLVLENDAMYSEFGIQRTKAPGALSDLAVPQAASAATTEASDVPTTEASNVATPAAQALPAGPRETARARAFETAEREGSGDGRREAIGTFAAPPAGAPQKAAAAPAEEQRPSPSLAGPPPAAATPLAIAGDDQASSPASPLVSPLVSPPASPPQLIPSPKKARAMHPGQPLGDFAGPGSGGPNPFPGELPFPGAFADRPPAKIPPYPSWAYRPVPAGPTASHLPGSDAWLTQGEDELGRRRAALAQAPESRKRFEELIRALLSHGRFDEALTLAKRFAALDPDSSIAQELLSYAAVAAGDPRLALNAVDAQVETDPKSAKWHARAARAFEAIRDERRACAHWRSLAELKPSSEEFAYESLRCRARLLSERTRALSEARAFAKPGKWLSGLIATLESGIPGPYEKSSGSAGAFEVEITCPPGARCPSPFILAPNGTVFSPFTPTDARSNHHSVALSSVREGTYRTLLVGDERDSTASVTVRALGATRRISLAGTSLKTLAITRVAQPPPPPPALDRKPLVFE